MATITLTEILGGDNISGSRITINDNFKRVANAINTLESRLDTSFTPGGSLNVGNALILKYTNPATAQIFTCEATGLFQGGLNVLLDLGVTQSADIGQNLSAHKNVTFDGTAVGGGIFTNDILTKHSNEFINTQLGLPSATAPLLNPQALAGAGSVRNITSLSGHSVLRIDLTTYLVNPTDNCDTVVLPAVGSLANGTEYGKIITVVLNAPGVNPMPAGFQIDSSTLDPGYLNNIIMMGASGTTSATATKVTVTLFADFSGWRVLNYATDNTADLTY